MIPIEQLTFETKTGGLNNSHFATAETAELIASMVCEVLNDKYTVTVEFAGSQYPKDTMMLRPKERELWIKGRNDRVIERLNAGLIAHTVINRGEDYAKERVIAELRWAGADL